MTITDKALLKAAEDLSTQLHEEEVRGLRFSPEFDAFWEELTAAIQAHYENAKQCTNCRYYILDFHARFEFCQRHNIKIIAANLTNGVCAGWKGKQ